MNETDNLKQEIQLSNQNTAVELAKVHQHSNPLVMYLQDKRIKECSDKEIAATVSASVEKARFDLGLKADNSEAFKTDNKIFIRSIVNDLKEHFTTLTRKEVEHVFHDFVRGVYSTDGKVFLTVANIAQAMAKYMMSQNRTEAKIKLSQLNAPPAYEPTEEEKFANDMQTIRGAFVSYLNSGIPPGCFGPGFMFEPNRANYVDNFNTAFNTLVKYRSMAFTDEVKAELMKRAKQNVLARISKAPIKESLMQRNQRIQDIEGFQQGRAKPQIDVEAKKLALVRFFLDLIEMDEFDIVGFLKPDN